MTNVEFSLLETMRATNREVPLLARHLERLSRSARRFGIACDRDEIEKFVTPVITDLHDSRLVRLLLSQKGIPRVEIHEIPTQERITLRLSKIKVYSGDPTLRHKTTARELYLKAREGMPEDMDALLANERGEITETTIANLAVKRGDVWITPHLSCGLLPGTMRAQLLEDGEIREGIVRLEDISPGELIRCFNAVRGVWDARLVV